MLAQKDYLQIVYKSLCVAKLQRNKTVNSLTLKMLTYHW